MADLAATGAADATGFTDGKIGEIIVQNELFLALSAGVGIELLRVLGRAERGQDQRLGFAAAEQRRAVGAGQKARVAGNRPDVVKAAAVHPFPAVQNQTAHGLLLHVVKRVFEHELGDFFGAEFFHQFCADFIRHGLDRRLAREFARGQERRHHASARQRPGGMEDLVGHRTHHDGPFGFAGAPGQFFLGGDDWLAGVVAELKRGVKVRLGNFLSRPLEHDQFLFVADVNEVEIALGHLRVRGIGHELAFDAPDTRGSERAGPGNIADHQRRGCADDAENVGVVFPVGAQQNALHLDLVVPTFRKERPDGPVNHAAGEDFLFRRSSFALEVTAGKSASRRRLLAVVHRQRKKVLTGFDAGGGHGGDDDDGFPQLNGDGAIGLFGELAGFDVNLPCPDLDRCFF